VPAPSGSGYVAEPAPGTLSVTGTFTVDTTTGSFLGGDVFVNVNGAVSELTYVDFINGFAPGSHPANIELSSGTNITFPYLDFAVAVPYSLVGYTGSVFCSDPLQENNCEYQGSGLEYFTSLTTGYIQYVDGSLTPASAGVTPEPSGMALIGTGLVGLAAIRRWRTFR